MDFAHSDSALIAKGAVRMRYSTVIFDVDGTLEDSASATINSFSDTLTEFGYPKPTTEANEMAFHVSSAEVLRFVGVTDIETVLARWNAVFLSYLTEHLVYNGIFETLDALKASGCKLGVVTSRSQKELEMDPLFPHFARYFDTFVCIDHVASPKPSAEPMLLCMKQLNAAPEQTLYIGDSRTDRECAAAAKVDFALAAWGARESLCAQFAPQTPTDLIPLIFGVA